MSSHVGCLILAGGQGTRLGFDGPKGCVELPLKEKKTLFQILLEKIKDKTAPVAIMTSPINHEATFDYLNKNGFFGLKNVILFQQEMEGTYPNGNGKAFPYFCRAGIWEEWKERGVKYLQVIPIDNPLAIPFDEDLIAANKEVELVLRGVKRESPVEKMGVILEGKQLRVEEYTETVQRDNDLLGNTGIFSCSMDFIQRISTIDLPQHTVKKKVGGRWVSKKEYFILDIFPYAKNFKILVSDRNKYFAPLKNASGPDSLETVAKALMT
ncbi:MAG: UTP--glucose-1-phosphate uridylyltransferase [Simkaniaceae bacterium]|nr:MAG: UTP--glucose-1-phosphate uridylyltransferase [Simkaniaceae bacterium]